MMVDVDLVASTLSLQIHIPIGFETGASIKPIHSNRMKTSVVDDVPAAMAEYLKTSREETNRSSMTHQAILNVSLSFITGL
jgi:hypothetical protein